MATPVVGGGHQPAAAHTKTNMNDDQSRLCANCHQSTSVLGEKAIKRCDMCGECYCCSNCYDAQKYAGHSLCIIKRLEDNAHGDVPTWVRHMLNCLLETPGNPLKLQSIQLAHRLLTGHQRNPTDFLKFPRLLQWIQGGIMPTLIQWLHNLQKVMQQPGPENGGSMSRDELSESLNLTLDMLLFLLRDDPYGARSLPPGEAIPTHLAPVALIERRRCAMALVMGARGQALKSLGPLVLDQGVGGQEALEATEQLLEAMAELLMADEPHSAAPAGADEEAQLPGRVALGGDEAVDKFLGILRAATTEQGLQRVRSAAPQGNLPMLQRMAQLC